MIDDGYSSNLTKRKEYFHTFYNYDQWREPNDFTARGVLFGIENQSPVYTLAHV